MKLKTYNNAQYKYIESEDKYIIYAHERSDMVVDAASGTVVSNAAWIGFETAGDFVMSAKVSHDFSSTYDATALILYEKDTKWAKACFECAEAGEHVVVSVMTDERSDDANGMELDEKEVWLQLSRKNNTIAVHYSKDGENWKFVRILHMDLPNKITVGMLAQSPLGTGGDFCFENFSFRAETLKNQRMGE